MPYFGSSWGEDWYPSDDQKLELNQYFIYGICVPFNWHKQWEEETGKDFQETFKEYMLESTDNRKVFNKDGIFCLFDNRGQKFIIVGQVLLKFNNENPIVIPEFERVDELLIEASVKEHFNLDGEFHYFFVKKYK